MRTVVYPMTVSVDGFVNDRAGGLDWAPPDDELHRFHNARYSGVEVAVHGRRLYELMAGYWPQLAPDAPQLQQRFRELWLSTPKVVFSRTLEEVHWNSRLVRGDPVGELRRLKTGGDRVMDIGGPGLAAALIPHGVIDEYLLFVLSVVLGAGLRMFPALERPLRLRRVEICRFASATMHHYRVE